LSSLTLEVEINIILLHARIISQYCPREYIKVIKNIILYT
jgi:hypothetical protein